MVDLVDHATCVRLNTMRLNHSWPMFSAFLYFLAMAFAIPVLPKVVNELSSGSKAVRVVFIAFQVSCFASDTFCLTHFIMSTTNAIVGV